ncbi:MAG TPA: OmpA family protein [Stellaceae bacterium]|nr:OmpA family protein [Stellaceae bacterium]
MFGPALAVFALCATEAPAQALAPAPAPAHVDVARFPVYFEEFSAFLGNDAHKIIANAAARFKEAGAHAIRIEGRASATGSVLANKYLAQTRTQVVADELQKDGISVDIVRQDPIGQTGSGDTTVAERRVDIVLER